MNFALSPSHMFFLLLSGWVNRRQQKIIDFQNAQIRALMDQSGKKRILLTYDQRRVSERGRNPNGKVEVDREMSRSE